MARVTADNYEALKGFALYLFDVTCGDSVAKLDPEAHPRFAIETFERRSMAIARNSVGMMIGDMIEASQGLSDKQVLDCNEALRSADLPTLTTMRAQFNRRSRSIMTRGLIRNENEYHALRNIADDLPDGEREKAWSLLDSFMMAGNSK